MSEKKKSSFGLIVSAFSVHSARWLDFSLVRGVHLLMPGKWRRKKAGAGFPITPAKAMPPIAYQPSTGPTPWSFLQLLIGPWVGNGAFSMWRYFKPKPHTFPQTKTPSRMGFYPHNFFPYLPWESHYPLLYSDNTDNVVMVHESPLPSPLLVTEIRYWISFLFLFGVIHSWHTVGSRSPIHSRFLVLGTE